MADKKSLLYRTFLYGYTLLLFTATLIPLKYFRGGGSGWLSFLAFDNSDKVVHFFMFFLLAVLLMLSYRFKNKSWYFTVPVITGIVIETLQHTMATGRTFDMWDILSNTLGTAAALLFLIKR